LDAHTIMSNVEMYIALETHSGSDRSEKVALSTQLTGCDDHFPNIPVDRSYISI
jgi:hypothetical protein